MTTVNKPNKIGMTEADGRPLSNVDSWYFDNCLFPLAISFAVSNKRFGNDENLRDCFHHSIKTSPLLQTMVEGEGEGAVFRKLPSEAEWPKLKILAPENDDDAAYDKVVSAMRDTEASMAEHGLEAHRQSVRMILVRGKTTLAMALICPHHFMDGMGFGALMAKFALYARLPRMFWPMLDRYLLKDASVPTYLEMALKDQYHQLKHVDGSLSKVMDPNNFCFPNYDLSVSKLRGLDYVDIGTVRNYCVMQKCRSDLRKAGVSISTAFGGLAVKTLTALIKHAADLPEESSNQPFITSMGIDTRFMGKWGDSRDRRQQYVPVIGNFVFPQFVQIPRQDAEQGTVEHIATIFQKDFERLRSDIDYRLHVISSVGKKDLWTTGMFCGVSSIVIPRISRLSGIPLPTRLDTKVEFGPMPRVWFYVVTIGSQTMISADVVLPISSLTPELVRQTILLAAQGSALEPLLR